MTLVGSSASHNGDPAALTASVRKTGDQTMIHVRKYSPFVALAFGFLFTIAWIAAITWFPVYFVTSTILQMLSLTVTEITRIPAALPLFITGLGTLGLLGLRRKKKATALAARSKH